MNIAKLGVSLTECKNEIIKTIWALRSLTGDRYRWNSSFGMENTLNVNDADDGNKIFTYAYCEAIINRQNDMRVENVCDDATVI